MLVYICVAICFTEKFERVSYMLLSDATRIKHQGALVETRYYREK